MDAVAKDLHLSVLVPIYNEAALLPQFFSGLAAQQQIAFEVIVSDGGSTDGSRDLAVALGQKAPFPCRVMTAEKGRGRQLNAAAALADAPYLLFLHVDSRFDDRLALHRGLQAIMAAGATSKRTLLAGHFPLRFETDRPLGPLVFYQAKARLDRPYCTHGDQGLLLSRTSFQQVGPFDEDLPCLEDTLLAERVRQKGQWLLLPAEISTSARRFEAEGLCARQILNAILLNCAAIGWRDFFVDNPALYPSQDQTTRLRLSPRLRTIARRLHRLPWRQQLHLWLATGAFVRANVWQIPLLLDLRRQRRRGRADAIPQGACLDGWDRWGDLLTDNPLGRSVAAVMVWFWFYLTLLWFLITEKWGDQGSKGGQFA